MAELKTGSFGEQTTPTQTLITALDAHKDMEFVSVVIVALDKDDRVHMAHSDGSNLEQMGMLQLALSDLVDKCIANDG